MELLRLFFGLPESEIVDLRDNALSLISEGKTIMNMSGAGKGVGKMFPGMTPREVLFEANQALRHVNPTKYGRRITKTVSFYTRRESYLGGSTG